MLEAVKKALRISSTHFDGEIEDLINAGKMDLAIAGINYLYPLPPGDVDPLIKRAIVTYCKANFGYDNKEADRFNDSYVMLKQHLSLCGEYNVPLE